MQKGDLVIVIGREYLDEWQSKDGKNWRQPRHRGVQRRPRSEAIDVEAGPRRTSRSLSGSSLEHLHRRSPVLMQFLGVSLAVLLIGQIAPFLPLPFSTNIDSDPTTAKCVRISRRNSWSSAV